MIVKPFQWGRLDVNKEQGKYFSILSYAKTPNNETVALNIRDYEPWIHVVLPEDIPEGVLDTVCRNIFTTLQKKLEKHGHSPTRYEATRRFPFFYYTTKRRVCMKIHFETEDAARHCVNLLRWPVAGHVLTPVDIGKISQETKLHAEVNIRPSDWISFNGVPISKEDPDHMTTLPVEYVVPWKTLKPLEAEQKTKFGNTKPSVLVFDHEMYSARKYAFPDELNSSDCIFMTGALHVKYDENVKDYTIKEYCLVYHRTIKKEQISPIPYTTLTRVADQKYIIGEDQTRHVELRFYTSEMDEIDGVEELIRETDPDIVLGHNSNGFDFKYHKVRKGRLMKPYTNMSRVKDWTQNFQHIEWSSSAYKDIEMDVPDGLGRIYFDTMFMKQRDYQKEDSYGLDALCQEHMGIGKHDHSPQKIFESFESNDPVKLRETIVYCMRDVWCTWGLFNHLNYFISYSGMSNVIGVSMFDLFAQGQGVRTITQIFKECFNHGYFIDAPERIPRRIAGGHVFPTPGGLFEWLWLFDFEGLYPSIMMEYNLGPDTADVNKLAPDDQCNIFKWTDSEGEWHTRFVKKELREGIIPRILEGLKSSRKASKDAMAACKKAGDVAGAMNADAEQNGKKISMNSIYGAMAQPTGSLALTECGATVTWLGRGLLQKGAAWLKAEGYEIIYGDTDSVMVRRVKPLTEEEKMNFEEVGRTLLARLNKACFGGKIGMAMDGCFRVFFTLEKKMYSFVTWDPKDPLGINPEKWKSKGMVTARRDSCKMMRRLYKRLSIMITTLKPVEEVIVVLINEIDRLLFGKLDIEEMVTIKGVSSDYKVPSNPLAIYSRHLADIGMSIKPGDRVPYVIKMNPKGKKQGDFYEDPDLFLREGMEYNRMLYLTSQFAGKLDKLLHVAFPDVIPPEFLTRLPDGLSYNKGSNIEEILLGFMALWVEQKEGSL